MAEEMNKDALDLRAFLDELAALCRRHGVLIHECGRGGLWVTRASLGEGEPDLIDLTDMIDKMARAGLVVPDEEHGIGPPVRR